MRPASIGSNQTSFSSHKVKPSSSSAAAQDGATSHNLEPSAMQRSMSNQSLTNKTPTSSAGMEPYGYHLFKVLVKEHSKHHIKSVLFLNPD